MKAILTLVIFFLCTSFLCGQDRDGNAQKNYLFVQLNHHLERRGSDDYETSNPDFALAYERDITGIGDHRFYAGTRLGAYREYVLTGNGWEHPEKTRFFVGISPSYVFHFSQNFVVQLASINDLLIPDDYNETWLYTAIELSLQYYLRDFLIGLSATNGAYFLFDPKADMAKAGIRVGYRF